MRKFYLTRKALMNIIKAGVVTTVVAAGSISFMMLPKGDNVKGDWKSAFVGLYNDEGITVDPNSIAKNLDVSFQKAVNLYNGFSTSKSRSATEARSLNKSVNRQNFIREKINQEYKKYNLDLNYDDQQALILNNAKKAARSGNFEFDKNEIGIYIEEALYEPLRIANLKYEQFKKDNPDKTVGWPRLKISKKTSSFEGVDTFNNLDYKHQNTPDLVFFPLDRVPQLVNDYKCLMPLDETKISSFLPLNKQLNKEALLFASNEDDKEEIYGLITNDEALLQFERGKLAGNTLYEKNQNAVNTPNLNDQAGANGWDFKDNSFFRFDMKNSWYSTSVIAGFLFRNDEDITLIEDSAAKVGRLFLTNKKTPYTIDEINALRDANTYIYDMYNGSASKQRSLNFMGDQGKFRDEGMFPPEKATMSTVIDRKTYKALTVEGSWMFSTFKKKYKDNIKKFGKDNVAPFTIKQVDPIFHQGGKNSIEFIQQPGGWAYGINKRNQNSPKRIAAMYKFMEIFMTDKDVILASFEFGSKIVKGSVARDVLNKEFPTKKDAEGKDLALDFQTLERQLLDATWKSKRLSGRVDQGLPEYGAAFGAFDGEGWAKMVYSPADQPGVKIQRPLK